ncbi:Response regulator receiver domain-containing protein [Dyadobacter soli]|uniref:Response regulator receiver domain-containing protein n=1 Tax=Dyadobacter soli TaxID=659014 RepID=A0A1G7MPY4_9BACT|nr:response regulator [Dyadobacter soli]SDF63189.1 Response regulator receiver domain-containing protein [Dyadobacter soli]
MALNGPIVIIDDDDDDRHMIYELLDDLKVTNPVRYFEHGGAAMDYLQTTSESPLLILCDVNMPVMTGLELRDRIDQDPYLKQKSIPFIFLTTSDDLALIKKAYAATIQGYFKKCSDFDSARSDLALMIAYWKRCLHPNHHK